MGNTLETEETVMTPAALAQESEPREEDMDEDAEDVSFEEEDELDEDGLDEEAEMEDESEDI